MEHFKLALLFCLFGFVPMAVVGLIAYNASLTIEGSVGTRFHAMAEGVADKIDRNLFERYGDVQAFGFNQVLDQKSAWYRTEAEDNPIRQVINQYVDTYDLYSLSLLVDLEGRVIAVNSKDADGKSIQTQNLYKKNYADTPWFRALKAQQFTTTMPFAAPGNTVATGTYIEDLHVDQDVKAAYPGDDGLTLGFSAPVYRDGKVVAYWTNRAKFSLVEDILRVAQTVMKNAGFANSGVLLLDKDGKILADYEPAGAGTDQFQHDFSRLFTTNLADRGLTAAKGAVAGKPGFATEPHPRTGLPHVIGYTHLKGALGYPGMNWSVLILVDHADATADASAINRNVLIAIILCMVVILSIGIVVGRSGAKGIRLVSEAAKKLAGGALNVRVPVTTQDEMGQLARAFNEMGEKLGSTIAEVREAAESVSAGAEQITKANEDLSQRTSEQASALEETSASMEEMTSSVKQNADNAKQANQLALAARNVADQGGSVTTRAVEAMGEINKSSKKIADIITVIDEIAFQTNLLALNAAVEAARAGEHGRGFAVVAAEVRNLAQRSATAAKEIKGLINESIQRVTDGSSLVDQSGKTLGGIVTSVKRVTDIIAEITAASQEQASGIDQVNKAIMQMDETTQQNAALVEETTSASQSMKDQAKELIRQVEVFQINGTGEASHGRGQTPRADASKAVSPQRTTFHALPKPAFKKPSAWTKSAEAKEPVGVASGNGKDRRSKEAEFEEF